MKHPRSPHLMLITNAIAFISILMKSRVELRVTKTQKCLYFCKDSGNMFKSWACYLCIASPLLLMKRFNHLENVRNNMLSFECVVIFSVFLIDFNLLPYTVDVSLIAVHLEHKMYLAPCCCKSHLDNSKLH